MKECFAISTYCNTKEKNILLDKSIDNLKQYDLDIMIHAHYPLSFDIQKKVNYYYYSSYNPVLRYRYNIFTYHYRNYTLSIKVYDYTYTVLKGWSEMIKILNDFDKIHIINYDSNITPELFNLSKKYNKSLCLEDKNPKYADVIYMCLKNDSYGFFQENITLEKYLNFISEDKFLTKIEEFLPSFIKNNENFYFIKNDEYNQNELRKYDIKTESRFDWDKSLTFNGIKIFIGYLNDNLQALFFNIKKKTKIEINDYTFEIDDDFLYDFKINKIKKIKINDEELSSNFIDQFFYLETKIYDKII